MNLVRDFPYKKLTESPARSRQLLRSRETNDLNIHACFLEIITAGEYIQASP